MAVSTAAADTPPVPSQTQDPHRPDPSPENAAQSLTEKVAPHDLTEEDTSRVKVADDIPKAVWLAALVAGSERFAWYGATGPFQNYLQNDRNSALPGALGLRQDVATLVMAGFFAAAYFLPILGALMADAWLGRYQTILISITVMLFGSIVLFVTSLPAEIQQDHTAAGGLIVAMVMYAVGSGSLRAAISPFIADQYVETLARGFVDDKGRNCVTDREATIQYIFNIYYWVINIAGLGAIATTFLERYVGFWAAFLPPMVSLIIGLVALVLCRQAFVRQRASGTALLQAMGTLSAAARAGFRMDAAKPQAQLELRHRRVSWDDSFVDNVKLALWACRVMLVFPFHWLCLNQTYNNLISQAGQMVNYGVPNDALKSINPLSSIIIYPIVQKGLYPWLRRKDIPFRAMSRITFGFVLLAGAMAYAAGVQQLIYNAAPCYDEPRKCPASMSGTLPNQVSVFLQIPIYVLGGLAEMFCLPAAQEIVYNQVPRDMRSITSAISISMAGFGALLAMAFTPLANDPHLVVMYSVLAGIMAAATVIFGIVFRNIDRKQLAMAE